MALSVGNCLGTFFSIIGSVLGYSAFLVFSFVYHNFPSAVLALISGLLASIVLLLNILEIKGILKDWYTNENLRGIRLLAFIGIMIGSTTMIWYIFLHIYLKAPILPVDTSLLIPSVWAFMTLKWGVVLFFGTRKYARLLEDEQHLLPHSSSRSNN